jgi:hypothetical protein
VSTIQVPILGRYSTDGILVSLVAPSTPAPNTISPWLFDGTNTFNNPAAFFTAPVFVRGVDRYRVHFTCPANGAPVGTLEVQYSLDENATTKHEADSLVAHWTDETFFVSGVATTSFAVNGLTDITLDQNFCNATWIRCKYTPTSGTITPTIRILGKGDGGR